MEKLLKFYVQSFHKYNLAEYLNFSLRFHKFTVAVGAAVLHYKEADVARYSQLCDLLQDNMARTSAVAETAEMQQVEEQRDMVGRYILDVVRSNQRISMPDVATSAQALYLVLKPYEGFYALPNMQETVAVNGMLVDLKKDGNAAHIQTLGLTSYVAELERLNLLYAQLTDERLATRSGNKTAASKDIRAEMDELYDYITNVAFAHNVVAPDASIASYITRVNDLIDETNAAYNQRTGQTKSTTESVPLPPATDDSGGTTPDPEPTPEPEPTPTPDPGTGGGDDDDEGGLEG
ncbi:MAG: hypothetical protein IKU85_06860 [Bacteroidaceae bacterium]|nr:hypothetical protein [Bacteroidaceae bacterium]